MKQTTPRRSWILISALPWRDCRQGVSINNRLRTARSVENRYQRAAASLSLVARSVSVAPPPWNQGDSKRSRKEDGMEIIGDNVIFITGKVKPANLGIIGLSPSLKVYEGYDGMFHSRKEEYMDEDEYLTDDELVELADHMIKKWKELKYKAQAEGRSKT